MQEPDEVASPPLFRAGHPAGDFVEAWRWQVLEEGLGHLRISIPVPDRVRNPRGQLFGGFTGTYVDLIALVTPYAGTTQERVWLATSAMRIEYLAPVVGAVFLADARLVASRGRTRVVDMSFRDVADDEPLVLASVTMREQPLTS